MRAVTMLHGAIEENTDGVSRTKSFSRVPRQSDIVLSLTHSKKMLWSLWGQRVTWTRVTTDPLPLL